MFGKQKSRTGDPAGATRRDEPVVRLDAVRRFYGTEGNRVTALAEVSLDFAAGTFSAIMGPSGSGKSTLLQCAAGLDRVDSGRVTLAGVDPSAMSETALTRLRRERIGFIFQSFNLVPSLTARQNIELPLKLARRSPRPEDVDRVLANVGLTERAGHLPSELSGGQQQRVAIARALVTGPQVVFADEPTGALDSRTSRDVLELLRRVVTEHGQTVIMVTHDPVAAAYADRVVFLADGSVVEELEHPTAEAVSARMTKSEAAPC